MEQGMSNDEGLFFRFYEKNSAQIPQNLADKIIIAKINDLGHLKSKIVNRCSHRFFFWTF